MNSVRALAIALAIVTLTLAGCAATGAPSGSTADSSASASPSTAAVAPGDPTVAPDDGATDAASVMSCTMLELTPADVSALTGLVLTVADPYTNGCDFHGTQDAVGRLDEINITRTDATGGPDSLVFAFETFKAQMDCRYLDDEKTRFVCPTTVGGMTPAVMAMGRAGNHLWMTNALSSVLRDETPTGGPLETAAVALLEHVLDLDKD